MFEYDQKIRKRSDIYCVCPNYSMKFDAAPDITPDEDSAYYTDPEAIMIFGIDGTMGKSSERSY